MSEYFNDQTIDILAGIFCLAALFFGYLNTKKGGDGFVATVSWVVAGTIFVWLYFTRL